MRPEHWLYTIPLRLRSLLRWAQADQELDDELRDHLERKTEEYVAKGMTQEVAHRRARLDLDGIEQTKEKCRDARRVNWIQDLIQDTRYGFRMLRKSPGFTTVAVLTLALGIGANTAIFSLMDSLMLRNLPVKNAKELVHFSWASPKWPKVVRMISGSESMGSDESGRTFASSFSYPVFERFASDKTYFSSLFGFYDLEEVNINVRGMAVLARGEIVTAGFFSGLGVEPILGRAIATGDENPGSAAVAVISWKFWRAHFSGDRN